MDNRTLATTKTEGAKRQERANRILDAAAELILRWGYDKTTIDDICRKAGVAKGTIYLHWKTREELFEALMQRESLAMAEDYGRSIALDPAGATLRGIYKHAALALIRRPLLRALILGDREVIGKLAQRAQGTAAYTDKLAGFNIYLDFLRQHGMLRDDLSLKAQVYTVTAIFMGFFMIAPLVPDALKLGDEELAELIGETIHCTLESERPFSAEELRTISNEVTPYLERILANTGAMVGKETDQEKS